MNGTTDLPTPLLVAFCLSMGGMLIFFSRVLLKSNPHSKLIKTFLVLASYGLILMLLWSLTPWFPALDPVVLTLSALSLPVFWFLGMAAIALYGAIVLITGKSGSFYEKKPSLVNLPKGFALFLVGLWGLSLELYFLGVYFCPRFVQVCSVSPFAEAVFAFLGRIAVLIYPLVAGSSL